MKDLFALDESGLNIICGDGMSLMSSRDRAEQRILIRRIVAAWNACAGISTDELEAGAVEAALKARASASGLLESLEAVVADYKDLPEPVLVEVAPDWLGGALAAIANAKNEGDLPAPPDAVRTLVYAAQELMGKNPFFEKSGGGQEFCNVCLRAGGEHFSDCAVARLGAALKPFDGK
ncbi:hypothetical protein [Pseudodesulfovibrio pelocollis]|uniref:hypothetical protein n=1 Tax=Pseudodesulfovibrio pelocollis TaxID=3051432 RepID=UPI00255A85A6|nr:hypothetical protein [Pseudodesulfovibrio sp. SB368]